MEEKSVWVQETMLASCSLKSRTFLFIDDHFATASLLGEKLYIMLSSGFHSPRSGFNDATTWLQLSKIFVTSDQAARRQPGTHTASMARTMLEAENGSASGLLFGFIMSRQHCVGVEGGRGLCQLMKFRIGDSAGCCENLPGAGQHVQLRLWCCCLVGLKTRPAIVPTSSGDL